MITTAAIAFGSSLVIFLVLLVVTQRERSGGTRVVAAQVRQRLDIVVDRVSLRIKRGLEHFVKYIVQLRWYYSIHALLRGILRFIVAAYDYFERIFERNRDRAKQLRQEKQQLNVEHHLQQVAIHKADTALTPAQKRKLRDRKLEGK